jgi:hypothetical protein
MNLLNVQGNVESKLPVLLKQTRLCIANAGGNFEELTAAVSRLRHSLGQT